MKAEAGDIDGTGKDTVVAISIPPVNNFEDFKFGTSPYPLRIKLDASDTAKPTLSLDAGKVKASSPLYMAEGFNLSVALAPMRGALGATTNKPKADQVVAFQQDNSLLPYYMLNTISDYITPTVGNPDETPVVFAADFLEEGILVGEVEHYAYRAWGNYASVIQAPPYHVDFIADPANRNSPPALRNYTYIGGNNTTFTRSTKEENSDNMSVISSSGVSSNIDASASVEGAYKDLTASLGVGFTKATGVENADKYISGKTTFNTSVSTQSPSDRDAVSGMTTDIHIWRYPVYGQQVPPSVDQSGTLDQSDLVQYMQYSAPFNPVYDFAHSSANLDSYTPLHEEGNLFSYPVQPSGTRGYDKYAYEIAGGTVYSMGVKNSFTLTFTDSMNNSKETSKTTTTSTTKSLNVGLGGVFKGLSAKAGAKFSNTQKEAMNNTQTWSSKYTTEDSFSFTLAQFNKNETIAPYSLQPLVFTEKSGTLHYAFAIRFDFDSSAPDLGLWVSPASPYKKFPDPALNLPHKYFLQQTIDSAQIPQFAPTSEFVATKIRGLHFVDEDGNVTGNIVSPGKSYKVKVPVANYSFVDTGPVRAVLSYNRGTETDGDNLVPTQKTEIAETTFELQGWASNADVNKGTAVFDWNVPVDMPLSGAGGDKRSYCIYVELDPSDDITEVHNAWSENDPGGNNVGYAEIAVLSAEDVASLSGMSHISSANGPAASALSISAANASDFTIELTNTTVEEIKRAARTNKTMAIEGCVTYHGADKLTRVHLVFEDGKPANESEHRRLIAEKYFPVIQTGASRDFHFTLTPSKLRGENIYMYVYGDGLSRIEEHIGELSTGSPRSGRSGGGGCDAGAWGMLGAVALAVSMRTLRRRL